MASSSLVISPSLPMEKFVGDGDSMPILSWSSSRDTSDSVPSPTERRSAAPWLMLPPEFEDSSSVYKFYRLAEGDVIQVEQEHEHDGDSVCLGSPCHGWLVYIQRKDCQLFLFNPISNKSFKLPSIETLPYITGVIRNSHSGLVERFLDYKSNRRTPQHLSTYIITKMVFSSSPMDDDCIALAIYGHLDKLAFCRKPRPGDDADCWAWTALDGPLQGYTQIVFDSRKKLFFTLTGQRELEAWDLHNDPIKRFPIHSEDFGTYYWPCSAQDDVELERKTFYCWDDDYLVYDHQSQELFIVTRYIASGIQQDGTLSLPEDDFHELLPYKTQTFDVFRLDFIDHDHVELDYLEDGTLGNRAFFIGSNHGFALSTLEFPELRPNSIYFTDDQKRKKINCGGHDLGIYDHKERSFLSCYYPIDPDKLQRIQPAPIWFTPNVDAEFLA